MFRQRKRGEQASPPVGMSASEADVEQAPPIVRGRGEDMHMDDWKRAFSDKLTQAQTQWNRRFEETLDTVIVPVYEEFASFLRTNGFHVSAPMRQDGRRSYKFELAENAYLLMIFRATAIGEFEVRSECFVPGGEPTLAKTHCRVAEISETNVRQHFQAALDSFVEHLAGGKQVQQLEQMVGA